MRNTIFVAGDEGIFWTLNLLTHFPTHFWYKYEGDDVKHCKWFVLGERE